VFPVENILLLELDANDTIQTTTKAHKADLDLVTVVMTLLNTAPTFPEMIVSENCTQKLRLKKRLADGEAVMIPIATGLRTVGSGTIPMRIAWNVIGVHEKELTRTTTTPRLTLTPILRPETVQPAGSAVIPKTVESTMVK
jgi:hypothetical protein